MHSYTSVRHALIIGTILLTTAAAAESATGNGDVVLHARRAAVINGAWNAVDDPTAAGGARLANPDAGLAKVATAAPAPASYFELTFTAEAGRAYHLWIRSKAQNDSWTNDSVYVQFSGSVTAAGTAKYRIGTTSALMYSLEEDSNMGESGWGWQDNGYGRNVLGEDLYFSGASQTIRVQAREDGISIDQIVLSPVQYATTAPGAAKNDTTILADTTVTAAPAPIPASPSPSASNSLVWTALTKASATGGTLRKVAGCGDCPDAGGASQQQFTSGSVSFTVSAGHRLVVGLGRDASAGTGYAIDYAFNFSGTSSWDIREGGSYRTEGPFAPSDVFEVAVEGAAVKYYRNGALVYTSRVPASGPLSVDATLVSVGATVQASTGVAAAPPPTTAPPTSGGSTLRILQWNIHHGGYGTDNVYDTNRVATWIVRMNPDVVMLNEVEKFTSWGNEDQPEVYKALLQQKTGKTWYALFAQEYGQWNANGKGNLILSTYPIHVTDRYLVMRNADRSVAMATITVNARDITLINTHLDPYDQSLRLAQATDVTAWAASQPENRIITGDMNAWPNQTSIAHYNNTYFDSWTVAASKGAAYSFAGNNGETKNGRIDYIFYSKASSNLTVTSAQVFDTRDANGVMPSDHRPVVTTFDVR